MSDISEILARTDPQYLAHFLSSGDCLKQAEPGPWEVRLEAAQERFHTLALALVGEEREEELLGLLCACNGLYLELGVRTGAVLAARFLQPY